LQGCLLLDTHLREYYKIAGINVIATALPSCKQQQFQPQWSTTF
jgi:hypothetical protein